MTSEPVLDRAVGSMLAAACGDALGVPYEFETRPLADDEDPAMLGGGLGPYAPGEYSDDTQMAVVIAQAATNGDLREEATLDVVAEGWITWMREGASDIGNQTWQVLSTAARWDPQRGAASRLRESARDLHDRTRHTGGNGSLMRTGPVALAFLDDADALTQVAREVSELTHPDEMAGDACVLWCHAIRHAVVEGEYVDLRELVRHLPQGRRTTWVDLVADAEAAPPRAFTPNGYAPRALQAAWSAVRHPVTHGAYADSPLAASLCAAVHAGNDTDTVAAITGALAGARWGASGLPREWVEVVQGWPGLDAAGLGELAVALAR
jgi:ADP-ribosylglycohydrolase